MTKSPRHKTIQVKLPDINDTLDVLRYMIVITDPEAYNFQYLIELYYKYSQSGKFSKKEIRLFKSFFNHYEKLHGITFLGDE